MTVSLLGKYFFHELFQVVFRFSLTNFMYFFQGCFRFTTNFMYLLHVLFSEMFSVVNQFRYSFRELFSGMFSIFNQISDIFQGFFS